MKLGFIGLGNMSTAIIEGLTNKGFKKDHIIASSKDLESLLEKTNKLNINMASTNQACIDQSDVIFLGVKPEDLKHLNLDLKDKPIVSMAAKTTIDTLITLFEERPICRIMPNLNVSINQGTIAYTMHHIDRELEKDLVELFNLLGTTYHIEEDDFSAFIALAGSSPALIYRFIDVFSTSTLNNFDQNIAKEIIAQTMIGSAMKLLEASEDPKTLIKNVSSKGGTTIEGLKVFDDYHFEDTMKKAARAIIDKDKMGMF